MEKYGVDTENEKTASARTTPKCPKCGKHTTKDGNVIRCPQHGTEPFEQRVPGDGNT